MVENLEKNIQPMRPAGESRQLRLKILSKSSAALRFATHGIWCFWASLPTATISLNKQDLLKSSGGLIFHPSCERVRILCNSKHTARVALGAAHPRRNINLASRCYDLCVAHSRISFTYSFPRVQGHVGNVGNECADFAGHQCIHFSVWRSNLLTTRHFCAQRQFNDSYCLSHIDECLQDTRARLLLDRFWTRPDVSLECFFKTSDFLSTFLQFLSSLTRSINVCTLWFCTLEDLFAHLAAEKSFHVEHKRWSVVLISASLSAAIWHYEKTFWWYLISN